MILSSLIPFVTLKIIPLALAILGFGLLIVLHELGHFIFCKLFNVHTPTFSIGFGPKIFEKKIGKTHFRLSAIPFGGYVEMAGNAEVGQGEQAFAHDRGTESFANKWYLQKLLIMLGGIIFNLLSAYLIFCTLFFVGDSSKITILSVEKDSAAAQAGLLPGDQLLRINDEVLFPENNEPFHDIYKGLFTTIAEHPNENITLLIKRKNVEQEVIVHLGQKERDLKIIGSLGAAFNPPPIQKLAFIPAIKEGISYTNRLLIANAQGLKNMFTKKNLDGAGGPLAIISIGFQSAQTGIINLFIFLAMMSLNLALFNLLPLGILDGGQLLFVTIEAIIRRPTPDWFKIGINLVSLALFALLFVYLTYKDALMLLFR